MLTDLSKPLVGIVMGSDSDLPIMKDASNFLDDIWDCHRAEDPFCAQNTPEDG